MVFDVTKKTIYWMIAGFIISIVMVSFALMIGGHRGKLTNVPDELEAELISLRFVNIEECFAYKDLDTGRTHQGILDLTKFNDEQMNECYPSSKDKVFTDYNFKLQLEDKSVQSKYFQNVIHFTLFKDVIVWDGTVYKKNQLKIFVQRGLRT